MDEPKIVQAIVLGRPPLYWISDLLRGNSALGSFQTGSEANVPESDWNSAWEAAARSWLDQLRKALDGDYQVHETTNFMILSEAPTSVIQDACRTYEDALRQILTSLEGIASDEHYGKHVVLMFTSMDDYYDYIIHFYPDGEHPMSGGVCLSRIHAVERWKTAPTERRRRGEDEPFHHGHGVTQR